MKPVKPLASTDSAKANLRLQVKRSGRSQIGTGTSEIRQMLIGRELFNETR